MSKPAVVVFSCGLIAAIVAAPGASAAYTSWADTALCGPLAVCSIQGTMAAWSDQDAASACWKSGSTYVSCSPYLFCDNTFSNTVPVRYQASCTGFGSESCEVDLPGAWSGCDNSSDGSHYASAVSAGSCGSYTLSVDVVPLAPGLQPAHLEHTITLCVNSVTGPSFS